uniref:Uncharacterized protein n=1 Tax=Arundo donax TaxID=35708 RepID=A0A0A8XY74_ARUDO
MSMLCSTSGSQEPRTTANPLLQFRISILLQQQGVGKPVRHCHGAAVRASPAASHSTLVPHAAPRDHASASATAPS